MDIQDDTNVVKEIFIFIVLVGMIFIRFFPVGEDNIIIKSAGYIGVIVSFVNFYVDARRLYFGYDKFHVIRGCSFIIFLILAVVLVLLLTGTIPITSKWSDVFTLFALLISLPENLFLFWIRKYIKGERK